VAPYMGEDSIRPFLEYVNKVTIVLGLTSNKGAFDFQYQIIDGEPLYIKVIKKVAEWGTKDNLMFVVGATKAPDLAIIRQHVPDHFLLIPGVGAQGGSLEEVAQYGLNKECGLLVNLSRAVIYASNGENYKEAAEKVAIQYVQQMKSLLINTLL
ncbi:MAG: orotidine 5'-phosphate decarboxylase / HUMPS family protein, partial [Bacteroidota bacterium]